MAAAAPGGAAAGGEAAGWAAAAALASHALALLLILALSALGNGAVLLAMARHRQLRTVTNAFVLSLALAQLLAALLCLPPALLSLLSRPPGAWPLGRRGCAAGAALHAGLGIAATLTMALLAVERYCAIARRPRRRMGRRRAAGLLAAAWLAALALAAPWYGLAGEGPQAAPGHCPFVLPWGSSRLGPPYGAALIVLCRLLPFALMCFCHYNIRRAARRAQGRVLPLGARGPPARARGDLRTATTVLVMVVAAIGCWAPYCALGLAAAAGRLPYSPALDAAASGMALANGAVNPLIYAARNPGVAALLRRGREGGYRTRGRVAGRPDGPGRPPERCLNGPGGARPASWSAGGGGGAEAAVWACRNPAVLFCRDGQPGGAKKDAVDTSV